MRYFVITPPEDPAVSLEEMKAHLRVDEPDDNTEIEALISAVQAGFESPEMGWLGRPVSYQKIEIEPQNCDSYPLRLFGPIDTDEDVEIVYRNGAGADVVIDAASYRIEREDTFSPRLVALGSWPYGRDVRIRCWAGLDEEDPRLGNFKSAIKLAVEKMYDGADKADALDAAIWALLSPYRVMSI